MLSRLTHSVVLYSVGTCSHRVAGLGHRIAASEEGIVHLCRLCCDGTNVVFILWDSVYPREISSRAGMWSHIN